MLVNETQCGCPEGTVDAGNFTCRCQSCSGDKSDLADGAFSPAREHAYQAALAVALCANLAFLGACYRRHRAGKKLRAGDDDAAAALLQNQSPSVNRSELRDALLDSDCSLSEDGRDLERVFRSRIAERAAPG